MPKRVLQGIVVSTANTKTIVIKVQRHTIHPLYKKIIKRSKKFHAHDSEESCSVGDRVKIIESIPISKKKRWQVLTEETDKRREHKEEVGK